MLVWNVERDLQCVVHGDGLKADSDRITEHMETLFEVQVHIPLGLQATDEKEVVILGRILLWSDWRIER